MEIQPGGIVPLHSHADRPALIMVNAGQIYENSSKCLVPILHKAGEISREFLGTQHWWKNEGSDDRRADDRRHRQRPEAGNDDAAHVARCEATALKKRGRAEQSRARNICGIRRLDSWIMHESR